MAYLTKYGTQWGAFPRTTGNVFFVAPVTSSTCTYTVENRSYSASDNNDGLTPERALATMTQAISNATANNGDVICLLPGTHNASTGTGQTAAGALAFNKAGITVVGLPFEPSRWSIGLRPQAIITAPAATISVAVTAADVSFLNVGFQEVSGQKTMTFTTAADRLTLKGCHFNMNVGAASTAGLSATSATQAPSNLYVQECVFEHDNTGTSDSFALDVGAAVGFIIKDSIFRHRAQGAGVAAWTAAIKVNDNANGIFDGNQIYSLNSGVAMTGTGVIRMYRNLVGAVVTNPFTGFAASDADLLNNYIGTVAGGTGGTLITSTT